MSFIKSTARALGFGTGVATAATVVASNKVVEAAKSTAKGVKEYDYESIGNEVVQGYESGKARVNNTVVTAESVMEAPVLQLVRL